MKTIRYFLSIALLVAVLAGCKKESFDDTSFVNGISSPDKLSVMFNITQDNTGLVTIIPNGEGVASYDIYLGDATAEPVKVNAGQSTQHNYAEGVYTVKIVGHGLNGETTETTQQLTVSFKAPEDLQITPVINGLNVSVSAKASFETLFRVYWGDSSTEPEPFDPVLEGQSVAHNYASAGEYTIRVVALSGGAATTETTQTIKVGKQLDLPVGFDDPNFDYTMSNFGGNISSIETDPADAGNKVLKVVKPGGAEVWAGTTLGTANGFATPVPLKINNSKMSMRIYSPAAGLTIKLKLEDHTTSANSVETDAVTTKANAWETLTFDFNNNSAGTPALNNATVYDKASVFFDFGATGSGKTFYMDDLKFVPSLTQIDLPVTFDVPTVNYTTTDFGNNQTVDAVDPTNAANKVKLTTKPNGAETWAGTTIGTPAGFASRIPLTAAKSKMTVRVYSPAAGLTIKLKVEEHGNGANSVETDAVTTKANAWETLTFDFNNNSSGTPALNPAFNYDKASLFFDFNVAGNGKQFYWDDVMFVSGDPTSVDIPLSFEGSLNYAFTDFEGGNVTIVDNPHKTGINTSDKVGRMIKFAGQTYGGSVLSLDHPIDFSTKKTFKMKVYSPRVGAKVLLKVENLTNGGISFEKEVLTTQANTWEDLTFDYSAINTANSYQKVVLIFDNGTSGDGSANFTWFFDDITLN
ncbi:hypothetical protein EOD41_10460 [Mucilaginibacter limnophilus]|uniref:PKD domain-containing protein n=1 Tax=Mucilaginibacter limnophilus TaxID=1932778 RepID=A0A3S2V8A0_9SPHI|nr:hypothetical protein [Mucilaginibacter limnophilus]RVU01034.1 hypothetical protein EOD41_10460 [Mucilaginibacter limnophilus]